MSTRKGRRRKGEPPAYCRHKSKGQAYVNLHGRMVYLGPYGSKESRQRYREVVDAWEAEADEQRTKYTARPGCTIAELVAAHSEHAREHYRHADGTLTSEVRAFALSLRPLLGHVYANLPATQFRPSHLKAIREEWIGAGHTRRTINQAVGRIRRLFRWGAGEELISPDVVAALAMVQDLGKGRSAAKDREPVAPAPIRDIVRVLRVTYADVAAMIRLQYYAGPRPFEVCHMRVDEVSREGIVQLGKRRTVQLGTGVWVFQPGRHKAKHTGRIVAYVLGKHARAALAPFLDTAAARGANAFVFPSHTRRGISWSVSGYQHTIGDACVAADAEHWSPGQLRHNFASRIDAAAGIQISSYALSHASINTTAIYVERNMKAVAGVIEKIG